MEPRPTISAATRWPRTDRLWVALLCLAAAVRVFVFSASFPFFSNVDEPFHFDFVTRSATGAWPRNYTPLATESLRAIARYGSPEFLTAQSSFPDGRIPAPLWKLDPAFADPEIAATADAWKTVLNFEASQPPLYYALAGNWLRLGHVLGVRDLNALYWIRFVNVFALVALVLLGHAVARATFGADRNFTIGIPAFIAFFPQDIFFSIENDVLSPVFFGLVFWGVLVSFRERKLTLLLGASVGLAVAATYLTKISNAPMLAVAAAGLGCSVAAAPSERRRRSFIALGFAAFMAIVPIALWMLWSQRHFGDLTGSATKIAALGWTRRPVGAWLHHPLFSARGFWAFYSDLLATFWRGEFVWLGQTLQTNAADLFYVCSSTVLLLVAALAAFWSRPRLARLQRNALLLAIACPIAGTLFLALLSIRFDYGHSLYPSRDYPYFSSGRLIAGCLVPFAFVYVYGLIRLLPRRFPHLPLAVLGGIILFVTASELLINRIAFSSAYNFFHQ